MIEQDRTMSLCMQSVHLVRLRLVNVLFGAEVGKGELPNRILRTHSRASTTTTRSSENTSDMYYPSGPLQRVMWLLHRTGGLAGILSDVRPAKCILLRLLLPRSSVKPRYHTDWGHIGSFCAAFW